MPPRDKIKTLLIYMLINKKTKQRYIGKWSGSIKGLINRYKRESLKKSNTNRLIGNKLHKHGFDSFKLKTLYKKKIKKSAFKMNKCFYRKFLSKKEKFWIKKKKSFYIEHKKLGLNLTKGGESGPPRELCYWLGKHRSEEDKEKIRKTQTGKIRGKRSKDEIKNISDGVKELWKNEEFKEKNSGKKAYWFGKAGWKKGSKRIDGMWFKIIDGKLVKSYTKKEVRQMRGNNDLGKMELAKIRKKLNNEEIKNAS